MKKLIIILGPTCSGKTDVSIEIAKKLNTSIISADSRQIYKELKIGTAVPTEVQLNSVKHYFIGNKSIFDYYNASKFEFEVLDLLNELFKSKDNVVMVGGSGMYIDAVCKGIDDLPTIDPELRQTINEKFIKEGVESLRMELKRLDPDYYAVVDLKNHARIIKAIEVSLMTGKPYSQFRKNKAKQRDFEIIKFGIERPREELYKRINQRVDMMIENGLIEEARHLHQYKKLNALQTVGYKELFDYFDGLTDLPTAISLIKRNTRHYAKKQISWFGRDKDIKWMNFKNLSLNLINLI